MIPKFRAWFTPFKGKKFGQEMKYGQAGSLITHAEMSPDNYVLMQYTGLKDKDGVEIFEGDIVYDIETDSYGKIIFEEGKFVHEWQNISEDLCENHDGLEIIGNIYENPELLEGAK